MVVFHVEHHNIFTTFEQCVTFNSFPSHAHEIAYYMFGMIGMYGLPLLVIIASYGAILVEISRKSRECAEQTRTNSSDDRLRRSGVGNLGRAKSRTLKMTILIVAVFIMCWTPYYVICLWYWIDMESAKQIDQRVSRGLFIFATSNSCMNPIVYGMFSVNCARDCRRLRGRRSRRRGRSARSRGWSERTDRSALDSQVLPDLDSHDNCTCVSEAPIELSQTAGAKRKLLEVPHLHNNHIKMDSL